MGRNELPNWYKKKYANKGISISLPGDLIGRIDSSKMPKESRSSFIEKILKKIMYNEEEAIKIEIIHTQRCLSELQQRLESIKMKKDIEIISKGI